jgi:ribosomal protein L31E
MAEKKSKEGPADERLLTIPLRRSWLKAPMNRRAGQSLKAVKAYLAKHMKIPEADIRISAKLNNTIWIRGAGKPPGKIRIKASLDATTGNLHARLPDEEIPKAKEEKKPEKPEEAKKEETPATEPPKKEPTKTEEKPKPKKPAKETSSKKKD